MDRAGVMFNLGHGQTVIPSFGILIYEEGQPLAQLVAPIPGTDYGPPLKVPLYPKHLKVYREPTAGRPALYIHEGIVVMPHQSQP